MELDTDILRSAYINQRVTSNSTPFVPEECNKTMCQELIIAEDVEEMQNGINKITCAKGKENVIVHYDLGRRSHCSTVTDPDHDSQQTTATWRTQTDVKNENTTVVASGAIKTYRKGNRFSELKYTSGSGSAVTNECDIVNYAGINPPNDPSEDALLTVTNEVWHNKSAADENKDNDVTVKGLKRQHPSESDHRQSSKFKLGLKAAVHDFSVTVNANSRNSDTLSKQEPEVTYTDNHLARLTNICDTLAKRGKDIRQVLIDSSSSSARWKTTQNCEPKDQFSRPLIRHDHFNNRLMHKPPNMSFSWENCPSNSGQISYLRKFSPYVSSKNGSKKAVIHNTVDRYRSWHRPEQIDPPSPIEKKHCGSGEFSKSCLFDISICKSLNVSITDNSNDKIPLEIEPKTSTSLERVRGEIEDSGKVMAPENTTLDSESFRSPPNNESGNMENRVELSTSSDSPALFFDYSSWRKSVIREDLSQRRKYILDSCCSTEAMDQQTNESVSVQMSSVAPDSQSRGPPRLRAFNKRIDREDMHVTVCNEQDLPPPPPLQDHSKHLSSTPRESYQHDANISSEESLSDFKALLDAFEKSPIKVNSSLSQKFPVLNSALYPKALKLKKCSLKSCNTLPVQSVTDPILNISNRIPHVSDFVPIEPDSHWSESDTDTNSSQPGKRRRTYICQFCKKDDLSARAWKRHKRQMYSCDCGERFCLMGSMHKHRNTCNAILIERTITSTCT